MIDAGLNQASTRDAKRLVIHALENPKWEWRTVDGLVRDTGLTKGEVLVVLDEMPEQLLMSYAKGREVYTTREHYSQIRTVFQKIVDGITGRVA